MDEKALETAQREVALAQPFFDECFALVVWQARDKHCIVCQLHRILLVLLVVLVHRPEEHIAHVEQRDDCDDVRQRNDCTRRRSPSTLASIVHCTGIRSFEQLAGSVQVRRNRISKGR